VAKGRKPKANMKARLIESTRALVENKSDKE
jgi:hypothetical protein